MDLIVDQAAVTDKKVSVEELAKPLPGDEDEADVQEDQQPTAGAKDEA